MFKKLLFIMTAALSSVATAAEHYVLDPGHTYPNFVIDHLGFSLMHGRFNETSGQLVMDRKGDASRLDVVIQAASIDTGHEKRDAHLRNADFFDVERHPTLEYHSDSIRFTGETTAQVKGQLTLLGKRQPVDLNVDQIRCGVHPYTKVYVCGFNATATLKRSDFGMDYGLGGIGDLVSIRIEAEAFRQDKPGALRGGPRR